MLGAVYASVERAAIVFVHFYKIFGNAAGADFSKNAVKKAIVFSRVLCYNNLNEWQKCVSPVWTCALFFCL